MHAYHQLLSFFQLALPPGTAATTLFGLVPVLAYGTGYVLRGLFRKARRPLSLVTAAALLFAGLAPFLWLAAYQVNTATLLQDARTQVQAEVINESLAVACRYDRTQVSDDEMRYAESRLRAPGVRWYAAAGKAAHSLSSTDPIPCDQLVSWDDATAMARLVALNQISRPLLITAALCAALTIVFIWAGVALGNARDGAADPRPPREQKKRRGGRAQIPRPSWRSIDEASPADDGPEPSARW
ncbi:hypothetical protein R70006_06267 [Paraburkholderia domus]|uniref:hypothetical protein n=1 Tax=Paraburkholderia domus TaxID=2793075 RepID=UPI0019130C77|nr:hypothetical protein [Paraburkholderia domus]MBK5052898.1 hypothetical protein [Burkholderia sp. R-70006]CAE6822422.1 hypothetical protein R70006_06267 [Paraburkholderia domus]